MRDYVAIAILSICMASRVARRKKEDRGMRVYQVTEEELLVHVPGVGNVPGKRAMDLVPGDLILFSRDSVAEVTSIEPKDQKSLVVTGIWFKFDTKEWKEDQQRTFRRSRPLAILLPTPKLDLKPLIEVVEKGLEKIRKQTGPKGEMLFDF